jgi:hypothetical protein
LSHKVSEYWPVNARFFVSDDIKRFAWRNCIAGILRLGTKGGHFRSQPAEMGFVTATDSIPTNRNFFDYESIGS